MNPALIIMTDLDGTLLDHNNYRFDEALPALEKIREMKVPLILNSSKTAAEVIVIREQLQNTDPFVVENGGGIYLDSEVTLQDEKIDLAVPRSRIIDVLHQLRTKEGYDFRGFEDMGVDELIKCTGLDKKSALAALERDYTEPLIWNDTAPRYEQFCTNLAQEGLRTRRGGRFIHVMGQFDKGDALKWLKEYYLSKWGQLPFVMALGDSDNDRTMLEKSDYPVLVRSPAHALPQIEHDKLLVTNSIGPSGWNTAVLERISTLN